MKSIGVAIAAALMAAGGQAVAANSTLPLPAGCELASATSSRSTATGGKVSFPPVQLEVQTPLKPTIFKAGGRDYLLYELHLQNFSGSPLELRGIEVLSDSERPIASLGGEGLREKLVFIGSEEAAGDLSLSAGRLAVAFMCVAFGPGSVPPARLTHRLLLESSFADGPSIVIEKAKPKVLAPPVSGSDWMAVSALSKGSHHRSGLFVAGGIAQISRRYAVDWKRRKAGTFFSGEARDVRSYHAYGEDVLSVADARVVVAKDGFPDNVPRTSAGFETAVPVTMETVAGNSIVLDLGDGQFAYYAHLKPGSLRVRVGDRVRRGELIASVGNSGDSREPHLHFQVTTGPEILASEGLPYVLDRFSVHNPGEEPQDRVREFPMSNVLIAFENYRARPTAFRKKQLRLADLPLDQP